MLVQCKIASKILLYITEICLLGYSVFWMKPLCAVAMQGSDHKQYPVSKLWAIYTNCARHGLVGGLVGGQLV